MGPEKRGLATLKLPEVSVVSEAVLQHSFPVGAPHYACHVPRSSPCSPIHGGALWRRVPYLYMLLAMESHSLFLRQPNTAILQWRKNSCGNLESRSGIRYAFCVLSPNPPLPN